MGLYICRGRKITVSQPLLNLLYGNSVGYKKRSTTVANHAISESEANSEGTDSRQLDLFTDYEALRAEQERE